MDRLETSLVHGGVTAEVTRQDNMITVVDLGKYSGNEVFAHLATMLIIIDAYTSSTEFEITYISNIKNVKYYLNKEWLQAFLTGDIRKQSAMLSDLVKYRDIKSFRQF
jgi:hypothetical protein